MSYYKFVYNLIIITGRRRPPQHLPARRVEEPGQPVQLVRDLGAVVVIVAFEKVEAEKVDVLVVGDVPLDREKATGGALCRNACGSCEGVVREM